MPKSLRDLGFIVDYDGETFEVTKIGKQWLFDNVEQLKAFHFFQNQKAERAKGN